MLQYRPSRTARTAKKKKEHEPFMHIYHGYVQTQIS